jgi:protein TonB
VETTLRLIFQTDDERVIPVATAAAAPAEAPAETEVPTTTGTPVETVPEPVAGKSVEKSMEEPIARPLARVARTVEAADELEEALRVRRRRVPWMWIVLTGTLAVATLLAVVYRGLWLPRPTPAAPTALLLSVESQDNGLISLRWNAASLPVTQAREGRLRIVEEQKAPRTVPMNAAQLSAGHLFYESSSDRVQFDLEVVEKSGETVHESVVAGQKPEPAPVQAQEQTASVAASATSAPAPTDVNPPVEPKPTQPAPRAFTPPSLPRRSVAQEGRLTLLEPAPALSGGGTAAPVGALLPGKVDIIPPPPGSAAAPPAPEQRVVVGGRLQSAMLIRKVAPVYPQLARTMRIQGVVRFEAVIGRKGEVKDLTFISGPRALEQAAADAVRKWVYRPTMLDGRPVEVSTQIEINFTLN